MSNPSYPPPARPAASAGGKDPMVIAVGVAVVALALPAALGALWARRFVKSRQSTMMIAALIGGLLFAAVCLKPFKAHMTASRDAIKAAKAAGGFGGFIGAAKDALPLLWLYTLPLTPIMAMIWDGVRPKSIDEQHETEQTQAAEKAQTAMDRAQRRVARAVVRGRDQPKELKPGIDTAAILAAKVAGESVFFAREHKDLLYLNTDTGASSLHMLFAGENGAGKTESMFRVAASVAAVTDWDIYFVNPKNDRKTMQRFYDLMMYYDRPCRLFPQEPYNGWEGDSGALLSRIMAIPGYATDGAAAYFSDMAEVFLRAVLNTGEPLPTSFEELEERLDYARLSARYEEKPGGFARVSSITREDAKSVAMRFMMMTPKLTAIRGDGWKLSETRAAYFGLPMMANERDSQAIAKFLLEDIKHYLSTRKDPNRRALFIIDEFSSLGTESVIRLAEMARSLGGIIMLGTQTLAGLGDEDQQQRIVGNMSVLLHRMSAPEDLTRLAGIKQVMAKTVHFDGKERSKRGTYRIDEADKVNAQDVRTLPTGAAWVIARGAAAKVMMGMMPDVPEVPIIIARKKPLRMLPAPAPALAAPAAVAAPKRPADQAKSYGGPDAQAEPPAPPAPMLTPPPTPTADLAPDEDEGEPPITIGAPDSAADPAPQPNDPAVTLPPLTETEDTHDRGDGGDAAAADDDDTNAAAIVV